MNQPTRWQYVQQPDSKLISDLSDAINVNLILSTLLVQRGITSFQEAKKFFRPSLEDLHDPFLIRDMDKAVFRLSQAIENEEKVLIYGDYDVDGTTSVALLYGYLKSKVRNLSYYINDRETEGYGISDKGIDFAKSQHVNLIISIDCGIKAIDQVTNAKNEGIDFIICDHHTPGDTLPDAYAVLDPKRENCHYPFKELSGCGIGFKLLQALQKKSAYPEKELFQFTDLLAVSIAADIVPIVDENRIFCFYGIQKLNDKPSPGLELLRNVASKNDINISGIVFGIAPRINAAGRIGHANSAVKLLTAETNEEAEKIMEKVDSQNTFRKNVDSEITAEAFEMIDELDEARKTTVLFKNDWHKGVVGIVASRCIEHSYKPTIILTSSNGMITGSARSVEGYDIYKAISNCAKWLDKFGGHQYAAGLSMKPENLDSFKSDFETEVSATIPEECLMPTISIDSELDLRFATVKFHKIMEQMGPFGPGNMTPIFESKNVLAKDVRILKDKHLKLVLTQTNTDLTINAIAFNLSDYYDKILQSDNFRIVYTIEMNDFFEIPHIQLVIKDIKFD